MSSGRLPSILLEPSQVPFLVQSEWDESGDDAGRSSDHPLRGENGTGIFNSQAISSEVGTYTLTAREDKRSLHTEGVEASDSRAAGTQSAALYHLQPWRVAESPIAGRGGSGRRHRIPRWRQRLASSRPLRATICFYEDSN